MQVCKRAPTSPTSRGYWGYWGYFSQTLENAGLFERPRWGYFGGYFLGRGYSRGIFSWTGIPTRKIPCVCSAPVDSMASTRTPKIATLRRIRWDERPETVGNVRLVSCARKIPCVCSAPVDSIRCGEPLSPRLRAPPVFRRPAPRPGSTCEGEPFPKRKQFGISGPLSPAPVNAFLGDVIEPRRLDFLNHPFARERHSRANAGRRIGHDPFAIRARVKYDFAGATGTNPNF